jgi:regulator of protease activity HflC (stomatin/prohibitin superfamily)
MLTDKIKKLIGYVIPVFVIVVLLYACCTRIDAGHVGIKVNLYGTGKGVQDVTEVTGWVFYNPLTTAIYEFPTFIQHKEYSGENAFVVNSKDGSEFRVSPIINYNVKSTQVPEIFVKYRRKLSEIEDGFLKTAVYDAFRMVANAYTADSLISSREMFEIKIKKVLTEQMDRDGFMIQQFTSNLTYPETFKASIEAKNAAVQKALQADNEVKTAEAEAKIKVAQTQGQADALKIQADADAYANKVRQQSLTSLLVQQQFIEKWDGKLPVYGNVPQLFKDITK